MLVLVVVRYVFGELFMCVVLVICGVDGCLFGLVGVFCCDCGVVVWFCFFGCGWGNDYCVILEMCGFLWLVGLFCGLNLCGCVGWFLCWYVDLWWFLVFDGGMWFDWCRKIEDVVVVLVCWWCFGVLVCVVVWILCDWNVWLVCVIWFCVGFVWLVVCWGEKVEFWW